MILLFVLVAAFAPWLAPYDPLAQSFIRINQPPSAAHWLGTDQFGRDVLSRMIYGSRNSLILGLLSPAIAAICGTTLGVIAGYFGGIIDRVISRLIDLLISLPGAAAGDHHRRGAGRRVLEHRRGHLGRVRARLRTRGTGADDGRASRSPMSRLRLPSALARR